MRSARGPIALWVAVLPVTFAQDCKILDRPGAFQRAQIVILGEVTGEQPFRDRPLDRIVSFQD
jgi:hypothetical protein